MGGGFMMRDCPRCGGFGTIDDKPIGVVPEKVEVDRRSKTYRESISKIMASESVSREDAVKIFDEEYAKID
jgi:hypothetical protein